MFDGLQFIRALTWQEVFGLWEHEESHLPHWIEHYKKRGFTSWKDWRSSSVRDLRPESLTWSLYEISEPTTVVPKFYAGPFRAWINKYYAGEKIVPFGFLASHNEIEQDQNISGIISDFPTDSTLVGLKTQEGIVIIEGLHRCCALAVAHKQNIEMHPRMFIACAEFSGGLPLLGQENSPT